MVKHQTKIKVDVRRFLTKMLISAGKIGFLRVFRKNHLNSDRKLRKASKMKITYIMSIRVKNFFFVFSNSK